MNLFIDGEWDGRKLLSLALVAESGEEWYVVVDNVAESPWVIDNVLPHLGQLPTPMREAQLSLQRFLFQFSEVNIVSDWPEDIAQFCYFMITDPGQRIDSPPLTFEIMRWLNSDASATPHNALSDARAIREVYLTEE